MGKPEASYKKKEAAKSPVNKIVVGPFPPSLLPLSFPFPPSLVPISYLRQVF